VAASEAYFILYVSDQARSASYYGKVLDLEPILDVPGITEFRLREGSILGLLAVSSAHGVPKAELYLIVGDPVAHHERAIGCGGTELSPMQLRDWGHRAAYSVDHDGHVLAFAEKAKQADRP
jgi:hypothetical protein